MLESLAVLPTWVLSSAATRSHQTLHLRLAEAGVSGYGYRCLAALVEHGQMSQTELAEAASLDPRDVTHTVRALEEPGLVSRVKDPGHGRRMLVSLTVAGQQATGRLSRVMASIQEEVFAKLSAEERSTLLALLARVG
ncbi:MarR family winged helix-turn-helix transcriptional regulator [Microbacterium paraoxydans]|uniref:MarR family winged helix-turn-helix transcriptional regulator n=1 Tax=Microbacterium paraoxydans TaxID=199592 RepID=UPI001CFA12CD|nr:MarR family transcriptional regulator [Microbacterium paraoxydans]